MGLGKEFIDSRVGWILGRDRTFVGPPVNLEAVAKSAGIDIRHTAMIPEGVFAIENKLPVIYLQSNFDDELYSRARQRFTLAHEICHSLFHDFGRDSPGLLRGTPSGDALEVLCNHGAGQLLVPNDQLLAAAGEDGVAGNESVLGLAKLFEVSLDVIVRRIGEVERSLPVDLGFLVTRRDDKKGLRVSASALDREFRTLVAEPRNGALFEDWMQKLQDAVAQRDQLSVVTASNYVSRTTAIHEVRLVSTQPNE